MNEDQKTLVQLARVFNTGTSNAASARALRALKSQFYQDIDWYAHGLAVVVRSYVERREIHDGLNNFYNELENEQIQNDIPHSADGKLHHAS
jgi:hypothetical protein